jgi:hypothetical protein
LRLIDKHIDFGFVRERLKDSYSTPVVRRSTQNCCCAFC